MSIRPKQLTELLAATIKAGHSVLITGAPGIGKTDIVYQAAKQAGADVIVSHPAVADPTDAKGLPWAEPEATQARFLPFGDLARAIKATKLTVWFLDDLGQASPAVQASFMQLLLARRVNDHVLPDCVVFVAATNRRTDKAGVSGILEPVKSRFATIVELEPNLEDWTEWAFGAGMPPEIISFLRYRPELLSNFQASADLTNSPTPRTWANAAKVFGLGLPAALQHQAVAGSVGEGAAVEFAAFLRLWQELPSIEQILSDPDKAPIPSQPATLYAVATALAMRATAQNFAKIARYIERLHQEGKSEFGALLIRDCIRRDESVTQTSAFGKLARGPMGDLMTGGRR